MLPMLVGSLLGLCVFSSEELVVLFRKLFLIVYSMLTVVADLNVSIGTSFRRARVVRLSISGPMRAAQAGSEKPPESDTSNV